jgi:hypothetical protein
MARARLQDLPGLFDGPIFRPGDRVLARVRGRLDFVQTRKLTRAIQKFACCDVRVLIVDPYDCRVVLVRDGKRYLLADLSQSSTPTQMGIANVSCQQVEFVEGDELLLIRLALMTPDQEKRLWQAARDWAGPGVPIRSKYLVG